MSDLPAADPPLAVPATPSAGAILRAAREAAGLSLDGVAQQLKLAPRQVAALEADDHEHLPGRTFVRGFLRNYARLLGLDPETVLGALPATAALNGAPLAPTPPAMGEIQMGTRPRSWSRWAIPLALVVLVAIAAFYEYGRPGDATRKANQPPPAAPPAAPGPAAPGAPIAQDPTGAPLPNPLAPSSEGPRSSNDANLVPAATSPAGSGPTVADPAAPAVVKDAAATGSAGTLVLDFQGSSWVEVRDRTGKVVLSITGEPGSRQTVSGDAPLDVVIGNAAAVGVTWQGAAVDVAAQQRQNVARLKLD